MPWHDFTPTPGLEVDGYRLVRFLGRGGFGEVWLCRSGATASHHAIKFISGADPELLEKEHHSLTLYRAAAGRLRSPHLVSIEHINRHGDTLYYVMPLADGVTATDPADPSWQPLSLAALIEARASAPAWFSSKEIISLILPILDALQTFSDAGLVHRDVKPENILFFNGSPCLGDISLLGEDAAVVSRRGTPQYAPPSWYQDGLPDMYGAAATFYTLLTGNPPDRIAKSIFRWPPQGEKSLTKSEHAEWKRLYAVIRRAMEMQVAERYIDFRAMAAAIAATGAAASPPTTPPTRPKPSTVPKMAVAFGVVVVAAFAIYAVTRAGKVQDQTILPAAGPQTPPLATAPPQAPSSQPGIGDTAFEDAQLAYYSLTGVQNDLPYLNLTSEQYNLFQDTLEAIQSHTWSRDAFEPELAIRKLDLCLDATDRLAAIPNVRLARLLLIQATGDPSEASQAVKDSAFTTPGTNDLAYRVQLLCRLNAADKAEILLDRVLADPTLKVSKRSDVLIRRVEVRARLEKFAEARSDAMEALAVAGDDATLKAALEMKLLEIEEAFPAYAAYLKSQR
jgi:serine/threonine protein kinase